MMLAYFDLDNPGRLILWVVGLAVCCGIGYWIISQFDPPPIIWKIIYVVVGVVLLLMALDFFFGAGGGVTVHTR